MRVIVRAKRSGDEKHCKPKKSLGLQCFLLKSAIVDYCRHSLIATRRA